MELIFMIIFFGAMCSIFMNRNTNKQLNDYIIKASQDKEIEPEKLNQILDLISKFNWKPNGFVPFAYYDTFLLTSIYDITFLDTNYKIIDMINYIKNNYDVKVKEIAESFNVINQETRNRIFTWEEYKKYLIKDIDNVYKNDEGIIELRFFGEIKSLNSSSKTVKYISNIDRENIKAIHNFAREYEQFLNIVYEMNGDVFDFFEPKDLIIQDLFVDNLNPYSILSDKVPSEKSIHVHLITFRELEKLYTSFPNKNCGTAISKMISKVINENDSYSNLKLTSQEERFLANYINNKEE